MAILYKLNKLFIILICLQFQCYANSGNRIISFETDISVKNNKLIREISYLIEVADKDSDWISDISIRYDKNDEVEIREAMILDGSGKKLRKLDEREISTSSDISYGSFYEDGMIKEFSLNWNEYPYRIQYTYRITSDKFLYVAFWDPVIYFDIPTENAELSVSLPADYEVTIDYDEPINYEKPSANGSTRRHHWYIKNFVSEGIEPFAPPLRELIPKVIIFPKEFKYGAEGRSDSWGDFGNYIDKLNEGLTVLPVEKTCHES